MGWIDEWVQPGMAVLDVGANVGDCVRPLGQRVGGTGHVWAIEPVVALHDQLARSASCVTVLPPLAVSDHEGEEWFYLGAKSPHGSLYAYNVLDPTGEAVRVRVATLDGLQATGELPSRLDAIKVDAQGAEAAILRGARQILSVQRPIWYLEIWPLGLTQAGDSVDVLCALLQSSHYLPHGQTWERVMADAMRCQGHGATDVLFYPAEMRVTV